MGTSPSVRPPVRDYGAELKSETQKWAMRLAEELRRTQAAPPKGEGFLTNIQAYQKDAVHFEEKGDLVRAFESVVWAWAWLEIGREQGFLKPKPV